MSDERKCQATTKAGRACRMAPLTDRPYCWAHDPESRPAAAKARKRGGRAAQGFQEGEEGSTVTPVHLEGPEALLRILEDALADQRALPNSTKRNGGIARLVTAGLKVWESTELEQRLAALEARVLDSKPMRRVK